MGKKNNNGLGITCVLISIPLIDDSILFQASLELLPLNEGQTVDHATAFGRIAFALPTADLEDLQKSVQDFGGKILTPLVSLDTPGKATVSVVILADPVLILLSIIHYQIRIPQYGCPQNFFIRGREGGREGGFANFLSFRGKFLLISNLNYYVCHTRCGG